MITICSCGQKKSIVENKPRFKVPDSNYVVLSYNKNMDWLFEEGENTNLTESELIEIEKILDIAIEQNNEEQRKRLKQLYPNRNETDFDLQLKENKRQYIPIINPKGEKEIWVNFFCREIDYIDWKKIPMIITDGGKCFFNIKVNLTTKTYSKLYMNSQG